MCVWCVPCCQGDLKAKGVVSPILLLYCTLPLMVRCIGGNHGALYSNFCNAQWCCIMSHIEMPCIDYISWVIEHNTVVLSIHYISTCTIVARKFSSHQAQGLVSPVFWSSPSSPLSPLSLQSVISSVSKKLSKNKDQKQPRSSPCQFLLDYIYISPLFYISRVEISQVNIIFWLQNILTTCSLLASRM